MYDLEQLRQKINEIDDKMIKLFEERMKISRSVAEYKEEHSMQVLDEKREKEVISKNLAKLKDNSIKIETEYFLNQIMYISRILQSKVIQKNDLGSHDTIEHNNKKYTCKVGFQGVPTSFSHQALKEYFEDTADAVNFQTFEDVFKALKLKKIDYGVLPIENSSTGGIAEVYDLFRKYGFYIVGEKSVKVEHNLLGIKGCKLEDIKEVFSHSQAFMQSSEFLSKYKEWKLIPYFNTAKSAEYVSGQNDKSKACIASKKSAELYKLDIIEENINYNDNNYTRFVIIGNHIREDKENNKISIVVSLPHKVGTLYEVLKCFKENNLNMMKIESRPTKNRCWEYFFYIDFYGNISNPNTWGALKCIEKQSLYFKLLGNYKSET